MIKTLVRLICVMFLLTVTVNGIAQSKPKPKSKPAATTKKTTRPVVIDEEVKEEIAPPAIEQLETVDTSVSVSPALPPLPEIDTIPPPNDELTKEIKKLLQVTNGINTSKTVMRGAIESQRKMNSGLPDEFYVRMLAAVENGQVSGYIEHVIVKIYRQKFTVEEVREVIKFYDSPIGKKMAAESATIADSARIEGEKVGQYVAIKIIEELMKEGKWK
jgi:uncharacterized protein